MTFLNLCRSSPEASKRPSRSKTREYFLNWEEVSEINISLPSPSPAWGDDYRRLLVQPIDIVSQDIVDVDGSSLYPTVNSIKELKSLICDMITGCSIKSRVLWPRNWRQCIESMGDKCQLTWATLIISRRIWAESLRPNLAWMLRLFTLASWKQATSACRRLSLVSRNSFEPSEEFNLLNIFMRIDRLGKGQSL